MKFKILVKLLYLIALFAIAAYEKEKEPQLIDSDPNVDKSELYQASLTV